jgi:hypothetical protein
MHALSGVLKDELVGLTNCDPSRSRCSLYIFPGCVVYFFAYIVFGMDGCRQLGWISEL